jgi:hypothetical protein
MLCYRRSILYYLLLHNGMASIKTKSTVHIILRLRVACRTTKAKIQTYTHNIQYLLFSHGNNGYAEALPCYVMCTLSGSLSQHT